MGAQEYADALLAAMRTGELVELPADLTEDEGYEIAGLIAKARQDAGDAIIGWKIGAAREDVQQMLGLTQPLVLPVHTSSLEPVRFGVLNKAAFEVECVHRVDARGAILASHVGIELMSLRTVGEMWGPWLVADQGVHTAAVVGDVMDVDEATIVLDAPGGVHMEGPFSRTFMPPERLADLLGSVRVGRSVADGDLVWCGLQLGPGDVLAPGEATVDAGGRRATMTLLP